MGKEELLATTYTIRDELKKNELVQKSKALEKEIMADPEIIPFIIAFKNAEERYNDAVRLKLANQATYSNEVSVAKTKLYNLPKVKEYFKSVNATEEYLGEIANKLFEGIIYDIGLKQRMVKR
ncbi:MAG: YlbF family regulator [Bacilli bacterium]|nr:YlbF family regulator [Bacilli bacterium]MDD3422748.1 YlbF family regulator [Bacilli bacterium]MDD4066170.1 YlbF family regulator [Bacilli bacterium]